jgi:hypothetical protein
MPTRKHKRRKDRSDATGGNKTIYSTLAAALQARTNVARNRGERWRRALRIYRVAGGWCLTSWVSKPQT